MQSVIYQNVIMPHMTIFRNVYNSFVLIKKVPTNNGMKLNWYSFESHKNINLQYEHFYLQ